MPTPSLTKEKCLKTLALLEQHGYPNKSIRAAAYAAGISHGAANHQMKWLQQRNTLLPLSENSAKAHVDWSAEQCIAELRRVALLDVDKIVTRNYFRVNSSISESTWNHHFGTFEEFKRQASITLTRQQHHLEKHIARHASVDHYRALNVERGEWAEAYLRKDNKRFKTVLLCSDLHDIEVDPFYMEVLLDVNKRAKPDVICLAGDIFDLAEFGKFAVDAREWDVVGRIKFAHDCILRPLREGNPDAQIDLVEGNHEFRLLRHMADATPALRAVLSDLHGFTIGKLLGLEEFEINYIAQGDLAAYSKKDMDDELRKNYKVYFDCLLAHHFPDARNMGMPGVCGHHHKHIVWPMFNPMFGAYEFHQLGAGHKRSASYCNGEKWHNGFVLANCDTQNKTVTFDYVQVSDHAVAGGKWYHRREAERRERSIILK